MGFAGSIPMEKLSGAAVFYKSVGEMLENLALHIYFQLISQYHAPLDIL